VCCDFIAKILETVKVSYFLLKIIENNYVRNLIKAFFVKYRLCLEIKDIKNNNYYL